MSGDWQTWAAAAIVTITLAIFLVRALRRKSGGSCGEGCSCDRK
jgi:hypothetical protein